jgi:hypothetical protein
MIKVTGVVKILDTNTYYLILASQNSKIACEVKNAVVEELLAHNAYVKTIPSLKALAQEYEFI